MSFLTLIRLCHIGPEYIRMRSDPDVYTMDYKVIKEVSLLSKKNTGKTRHYSGTDEIPSASKLQIAQYEGDDGYYLFYLAQNDEVMTDTYHSTIETAMEQAAWEYDIQLDDWLHIL